MNDSQQDPPRHKASKRLSGTPFIWSVFCLMILNKEGKRHYVKKRTSLVAQWLRIHLPMQATWVRSLVQEDPTCRGATKPVRHNYWACALEPTSHNYWAHVPQLLKPTCLEPVLCNKRSHHTATKSRPCSPQLEKARMQQRRPKADKKKIRHLWITGW